MKGHTNNPNGRPPIEAGQKRVVISVRVKPSTASRLKRLSAEKGLTQSAIVEDLIAAAE